MIVREAGLKIKQRVGFLHGMFSDPKDMSSALRTHLRGNDLVKDKFGQRSVCPGSLSPKEKCRHFLWPHSVASPREGGARPALWESTVAQTARQGQVSRPYKMSA